MLKEYVALVEVGVRFIADEDNLGEDKDGSDITIESLSMDVVYGRDKKDHDRTDNDGEILSFRDVFIEEVNNIDTDEFAASDAELAFRAQQ